MGRFSAQVQQPQTGQPSQSIGKGGSAGQSDQQVLSKTQNQIPSYMQDNFSQSRSPSNQSFNDIVKPMGKGGNYQTSATSGQPRAGMPNNYSNTVGQSDNTQIQQPHGGGKGKG